MKKVKEKWNKPFKLKGVQWDFSKASQFELENLPEDLKFILEEQEEEEINSSLCRENVEEPKKEEDNDGAKSNTSIYKKRKSTNK